MKISRIELYHVKIPLSDKKPGFFGKHSYFLPNWIPGLRQFDVAFYLLKLVTDEGYEGYSSITAVGDERKGLGSIMGSYLLGINPLDIDLVNQRIQEFSYIGMRNPWIEVAFWDIIGKVMQKPIWELLGGSGGYVFPYFSTGGNYDHDPVKSREATLKAIEKGYKGIKLRVKHTDINTMFKFVEAARKAGGDYVDIMVDANQGWPVDLLDETPKWDVDFAISFCKELEALNLKWLEEPINRGNFEGLAKIRKNTKVPIAGGELNSNWNDFKTMLALGSLDIYQPDATLAGGTYAGGISVTNWLIKEIDKINKKNENEEIKFCPHTWTTGLGFIVALHLVGVLPKEKRELIEYPFEGDFNPKSWGRFLKHDFSPDKDGKIKIPEEPGLGIEIDWDIIRKFGKRIYVGTKNRVAFKTLRDHGFHQTLHLKKKKQEQIERSSNKEFKILEPPF